MATHSSTLAWKIPWMEEPGRLQSMGSLRVGHDWTTSLSLFTFMHWRRKWQPTPVFLPGESQGRRSLVGCCLWGRTESDTTEAIQQQLLHCRQILHHLSYQGAHQVLPGVNSLNSASSFSLVSGHSALWIWGLRPWDICLWFSGYHLGNQFIEMG